MSFVVQGWIAAVNMASDIYATGLQYVDNVLMSLAASSEMDERSRFITTKLMMLGFDHAVKTSLQSVVCPGFKPTCAPHSGIIRSMCQNRTLAKKIQIASGWVFARDLKTDQVSSVVCLSVSPCKSAQSLGRKKSAANFHKPKSFTGPAPTNKIHVSFQAAYTTLFDLQQRPGELNRG